MILGGQFLGRPLAGVSWSISFSALTQKRSTLHGDVLSRCDWHPRDKQEEQGEGYAEKVYEASTDPMT